MRIGDLISKCIIEFSRNLSENISLIDIGCGKGDYTILLKGENRTLYGLDIRNRLKEYRGEIKFILGNATSISFRDATFDAVVSLDVIEHIKDDKQFVSEFFRILKPGGQFLCGTPNRDRLANVLGRLIGRGVGYLYRYGHVREYDEKSLRETIAEFTKTFKIFPLGTGISGRVFCKIPYLLKKYCSYFLIVGRK